MANTLTLDTLSEPSTVFGNCRIVQGVLHMTDGVAGSSVATGLDYITFGMLSPKSAGAYSQFPPTTIAINSDAGGSLKAKSAGSGDTYHVFIVGR